MRSTLALGLVVMCSLSAPISGAEAVRIVPVDEGLRDARFAAYRRDLLRAATAGDVAGVLALIPDQVRYDEEGLRKPTSISAAQRRAMRDYPSRWATAATRRGRWCRS